MHFKLAPYRTDLSSFQNPNFNRGAARWKEVIWLIINAFFLINPLSLISSVKVFWLRIFGAQIGKGVLIKPGVQIKFPWKLKIGDHCWIGENVWIDNLAEVDIGNNVCISQGAMLLCGNHDYKKTTFDLITQPIILEEGVWIGAKAVVCPGVIGHSHAVLAVGSVATQNLEAYSIYQGNPAVKVRERIIGQ